MQILEAALAFAITMLVLSLTCSSIVELVHRTFSMREAGLKYMLGRVFDQVLGKYIAPGITAEVQAIPALADAERNARVAALLEQTRKGFVERMSANRAPMGVTPNATPSDPAANVAQNRKPVFGLWNGRDLSSMTPSEFMERLGSIDLGQIIKQVNDQANAAGGAAADMADALLTDIAQKFEAFGNEAGSYFEGRARLLSVCVAVVLAFAIRVDAIELFNTYLRDPNARNNVIEQTQAVTAQYKAAKEAADALQKVSSANPSAPEDVKKQIDALQKDWQSTIDTTRSTVKQYADLGLPIGWTKQNATLDPGVKTCAKDDAIRLVAKYEECKSDETAGKVGWWPVLKLIGSLVLGGLLIGLGGPFWYDAVTGLTNIRSIAKDIAGNDQTTAAPKVAVLQVAPADAAAQAAAAAAAQAAARTPDRSQPATPVGAFKVSRVGVAGALPPPAVPQGGGG